MKGKIILFVAIGIVLILLTGYVIMSETFEDSTKSISYHEDGHIIDKGIFEQGSNITIEDYENKASNKDYTFFGWNTSPDFLGEVYNFNSTMILNENISLYAMKIKGTIKENQSGVFDFSTSVSNEDTLTVLDMRFFEEISEVRVDNKTLCSIVDNKTSLEIIYPSKTSLKFNECSLSQCISLMNESSSLSIDYSEDIASGLLAIEIKIDNVPLFFSDESNVSISILWDGVNEDAELKIFKINNGSEKHINSIYENKVLSFNVTDVPDFKVVPLFNVLFSQDETLNSNSLPSGFSINSDSKYFKEFRMLAVKDIFTISYSGSAPMKYDVEGVDQVSDDTFRVTGSSTVSILAYEGDGTYKIVLPTNQIGYSVKSEKSTVSLGERCIVNYELKSGYLDDDIVVSVNDKLVTLDSLGRLYLDNIRTDQIIQIKGVVDSRSYSIKLSETQIGYTITSDKENSRHGESYTLKFELSTGYEKTEDFKIHLDELVLDSTTDTIVVENVMATHNVMVTGVGLIEYNIIAGTNTVLKVDGQSSTFATINDTITVEAELGYSLPVSYNDNLPEFISVIEGNYSITDNVTFPNIVKLILGDNILVKGSSQSTLYLCSEENVTISAKPGYDLPSKYNSTLLSMQGVSYTNNKYSFGEDTNVPSIYRVEYLSEGKVYAFYNQIVGEEILAPGDPIKIAYSFEDWGDETKIVNNNVSKKAVWLPNTYSVNFGPKLFIILEGEPYESPKTIEIKSDQKFIISALSDLDMPAGYEPNNENIRIVESNKKSISYYVTGDTSFPGLSTIEYWEATTPKSSCNAIIGNDYVLLPLPNWTKEGHTFVGWMLSGEEVEGNIATERDYYVFIAKWREDNI